MRAALPALPAFALAACVGAQAPAGDGSTDAAALFASGTSWTVVAIDLQPVPAGISPTIQREGDRVGGNGGCNQFGGAITVSGQRLTFGEMASTLMACQPAAMEVEARLHGALKRVDGVRAAGGTLQLTAQGRPVVTLVRAAD